MTITLPAAREETERLQARIVCVEELDDRCVALSNLAPQLIDRLDAIRTAEEITRLHEQVTTATDLLDQAVTRAARVLDPLSFKLARTRHRGVYRSESRYVVPYVDDLGLDRRREFETLAEAHDFRTALRLIEKAQKDSEWTQGIPGPGGE